ncbi:diguanylate cyclase [Actinoplanes sp. NPDC026619]|uniref:sensor domain-containing diguanylate cyclase n=1 Tax=Actinoplanes sp. NPDC026619 TaxID=3155798 RepID=UPI00340FEE12
MSDSAARSAELDRLEDWTGLDSRGRAARAAELELAAATAGDDRAEMRARLIQADVAERSGELKTAVAVMWQVNEWAHRHQHRYLIARSHLMLGRTYRNMGDVAALLEHAVAAVEHLDDSVPPRRRLPYVVKYADALTETGSIAEARERYRQAAELARHSTDVRDEILVLNNHAYAEYLSGEPERAWELIERMRAAAAAREHRLDPNDLDTVASVQIALGRYAEAEQTILDAIAAYPEGHQEADSLPEFLLTLAETRRLRGDAAAARDTLAECRTLCETHGHGEILARVFEEQAELYAAAGDFQKAYEEYKLFHAAEKKVLDEQREAQARTRQALFEVNEARQETERFREQARRDPLTGLRNRRYVDEHLPVLIGQAQGGGAPMWAAVLDLDHFKQINDRCSHEIGDQVLVMVAALLSDAVAGLGEQAAFAARLGGEEFLLVLSGHGHAEALSVLEKLRRRVADHPWRQAVGDLPVTVSIGAAAVVADSNQSTLLARADAQLYAAKRAGRNRVRTAGQPAGAIR